MDGAGDCSPNRKVAGFYAQVDRVCRSRCPGPDQVPGMASLASALGASLRTSSGNLGNDVGLAVPSASDGTVEVRTLPVTPSYAILRWSCEKILWDAGLARVCL